MFAFPTYLPTASPNQPKFVIWHQWWCPLAEKYIVCENGFQIHKSDGDDDDDGAARIHISFHNNAKSGIMFLFGWSATATLVRNCLVEWRNEYFGIFNIFEKEIFSLWLLRMLSDCNKEMYLGIPLTVRKDLRVPVWFFAYSSGSNQSLNF